MLSDESRHSHWQDILVILPQYPLSSSSLPRQIPRIFPCLQTLEITEATLDFSGESKETFLDALGGVWSTLKVGASVVEYVMPKPVLTSWKNIPTDIPVLSPVTQETETAPGCTASCAISIRGLVLRGKPRVFPRRAFSHVKYRLVTGNLLPGWPAENLLVSYQARDTPI